MGLSFFVSSGVLRVACYLLHHLEFALSGAADFRLNCSAAFVSSAFQNHQDS